MTLAKVTARNDFVSLEYNESITMKFIPVEAFLGELDDEVQIRETANVKIVDANRKSNYKKIKKINVFHSY